MTKKSTSNTAEKVLNTYVLPELGVVVEAENAIEAAKKAKENK